MQVELKDLMVDVEIILKNNKNIYFRCKDNKLVVTCNKYISKKYLLELIKKNEDSLHKMFLHNNKEIENDRYFNYLGEKYVIVYDNESKIPKFTDDMVIVKDKKVLDKFYQKECVRIFENEVNRISSYFNNIPKFSLKIRKMKTRWGVNNRGNNTITLNSELIKKDVSLIDYVCVHELCHFLEANHSDRFWYQVGLRYPNYKLARKMLREV